MSFSVTFTNRASVQKGYRNDINMNNQRAIAYRDSRQRLQQALLTDFESTVATRDTHHVFLKMMLREVQRYQKDVHDIRIPEGSFMLLAEENAAQMTIEDCDHYAVCLKKMCSNHLYAPEFLETAECLAQQYEQRQLLKKQNAATSVEDDAHNRSFGLSDDSEGESS